ncbi:hypothetical protein CPC08DRAFT_99102 [Agrocybe pediades]|nr:hypothetical protein CPC08DRAFT_99102 [Agrocybe pediades]
MYSLVFFFPVSSVYYTTCYAALYYDILLSFLYPTIPPVFVFLSFSSSSLSQSVSTSSVSLFYLPSFISSELMTKLKSRNRPRSMTIPFPLAPVPRPRTSFDIICSTGRPGPCLSAIPQNSKRTQ